MLVGAYVFADNRNQQQHGWCAAGKGMASIWSGKVLARGTAASVTLQALRDLGLVLYDFHSPAAEQPSSTAGPQ